MSEKIPFNTLVATATTGVTANMSLREGLEACRTRYGLQKQQFAAVLGMPASHYTGLIKPEGTHRPLTLRQASRAFAIGVPAEVLLQGPNP
jgi:hypothetical protein